MVLLNLFILSSSITLLRLGALAIMALMKASMLYLTSSEDFVKKGIGVPADISAAIICMNLELFRIMDSRIARVWETIAGRKSLMSEGTYP